MKLIPGMGDSSIAPLLCSVGFLLVGEWGSEFWSLLDSIKESVCKTVGDLASSS
jgi:hypothetical protein